MNLTHHLPPAPAPSQPQPPQPEIYVPSVSTNPTDPTLVLLTFAPGAGLPTSSTALVVATYTTPSECRAHRTLAGGLVGMLVGLFVGLLVGLFGER